ncbi:hypothetical protein BHM03_00045366 [Ensete ventricosum]|nr:hypothetical protein BHM03_00045366 [Ensete ventricosum]
MIRFVEAKLRSKDLSTGQEDTKENKIDASLAIGWQRPCMRVVVCLSKGNCSKNTEVLKQEVEKGEEAMTSPEGFSYPKAKR